MNPTIYWNWCFTLSKQLIIQLHSLIIQSQFKLTLNKLDPVSGLMYRPYPTGMLSFPFLLTFTNINDINQCFQVVTNINNINDLNDKKSMQSYLNTYRQFNWLFSFSFSFWSNCFFLFPLWNTRHFPLKVLDVVFFTSHKWQFTLSTIYMHLKFTLSTYIGWSLASFLIVTRFSTLWALHYPPFFTNLCCILPSCLMQLHTSLLLGSSWHSFMFW